MGARLNAGDKPESANNGPGEHLGAPATSLCTPCITVEQAGKNIPFGNAAGAPRNHSYYFLEMILESPAFSLYSPLCIDVSMYLYRFPSTSGMSGLAADSA
jgi:hypothetical protein